MALREWIPFSAATIRLVVQGIEERGVLGECDGVISGYLGWPIAAKPSTSS